MIIVFALLAGKDKEGRRPSGLGCHTIICTSSPSLSVLHSSPAQASGHLTPAQFRPRQRFDNVWQDTALMPTECTNAVSRRNPPFATCDIEHLRVNPGLPSPPPPSAPPPVPQASSKTDRADPSRRGLLERPQGKAKAATAKNSYEQGPARAVHSCS